MKGEHVRKMNVVGNPLDGSLRLVDAESGDIVEGVTSIHVGMDLDSEPPRFYVDVRLIDAHLEMKVDYPKEGQDHAG
jgi:hypothetical protein